MDIGSSITDGITAVAVIDWPGAISALDTGELPGSGGERRVLRLVANLADGIPVAPLIIRWISLVPSKTMKVQAG